MKIQRIYVTVVLQLLMQTYTSTKLSSSPRLIQEVKYSGRRAARARTYGDRLYVTTRQDKGLYVFDIQDEKQPKLVYQSPTMTCLEGQDMNLNEKYIAFANPCEGTVLVAEVEDLNNIISKITLWPNSSALHVRWINETNLVVSNPGRLWTGETWGETTAFQKDGVTLLTFSKENATIRKIGSISPGNVNGTESLTLISNNKDKAFIGGFRSNALDLVDLNRMIVLKKKENKDWKQMVGVWDEDRDVALLGLWTEEGGLVALDQNLREIGKIKGLSYANRVKKFMRQGSSSSSRVAVPLEVKYGGGFAIVNITNVRDMKIESIIRSGVGSGVNDTVYALEVGKNANLIYVAATDGVLRVYEV